MVRGSRRLCVGILVLVLSVMPGCGHELVRTSVEPAAVTPDSSPRDPLLVPVRCVSPASEQEPLLEALRACGAFRGPLLAEDDDAAAEASVIARLTIEPVSRPEITTSWRMSLAFWSCVLPILAPFLLVWTEREPDLVEELTLELGVAGEAPAGRYRVTARGTIAAQTPHGLDRDWPERRYDQWIADEHRPAIRAQAIPNLAAQLAADATALRTIAEQLDESSPTVLEPLLVAEETHLPRATWRTRRLIAWKASALDGLLAEATATELRVLVGRVEACMVELARGAELEKDQAEATVLATGGAGRAARGLSLVYRERLEVLRPILNALNGELDARSR